MMELKYLMNYIYINIYKKKTNNYQINIYLMLQIIFKINILIVYYYNTKTQHLLKNMFMNYFKNIMEIINYNIKQFKYHN